MDHPKARLPLMDTHWNSVTTSALPDRLVWLIGLHSIGTAELQRAGPRRAARKVGKLKREQRQAFKNKTRSKFANFGDNYHSD